jgi:hypothetical protein
LTEMDVLTVSVKTAQTFEATTIREKGYLYHTLLLPDMFFHRNFHYNTKVIITS